LISKARKFLQLLPREYLTKERAIDPDGEVSLDWIFSKNSVLSVSVGDSLSIAWIHKGESGNFVEEFNGCDLPPLFFAKLKEMAAG